MAVALVASVDAGPGANGGTTASIDTTGSNLIVISIGFYAPGGAITVSDSKGNTYTSLTAQGTTYSRQQLFYKLSPIVGTGHTFTVSGTGIYPAILVKSFSGVGSYHSESGSNAASGASLASGNVTPTVDGSLICTGSCGQNNSVDTATGFTISSRFWASGINLNGSIGYQIQSTAATINPTWSYSPTQASIAVSSAVFTPTSTTEGRISQLPVEIVLVSSSTIELRLSQLAVEVLIDPSIVPPVTETVQFVIVM